MQGQVYQIKNLLTGIYYAAKIYETTDGETINDINNEVQILSFVSHPNIIQFKKFYRKERNGLFIIINEFFPSISLENYIKTRVPKAKEKNEIARTLINIVIYLQENNIIHGDFNLSNILINPDTLEIKLIDFGVSKLQFSVNEFQSPKGFTLYRPPAELQIFYQSDIYDLWGLMLVLMSVFLGKKVNTKVLLKFFEEFEENSIKNEEFFWIIQYMREVYLKRITAEELKQSIYVLKDMLLYRC